MEEILYDIIYQKKVQGQTKNCMAFLRFLLHAIEKINFRFSFLSFELEGWAENTF